MNSIHAVKTSWVMNRSRERMERDVRLHKAEVKRLRRALGKIANVSGSAKNWARRRREVATQPLLQINEIALEALSHGR